MIKLLYIQNANIFAKFFGENNRHNIGPRSHTIFRLIIESSTYSADATEDDGLAVTISHLNLVDLAGSERASQTGAVGERFTEGKNINR
jgi:centromeric protein E